MSDAPKTIQPYIFHGMDLVGDTEAIADCPWCSKEGKFSVNVGNGKWQCFVCGETGNAYTFLRKLWEISRDITSDSDLKGLAESRGVDAASLGQWGICKSALSGDWLVPGFNQDRKLAGLYKYVQFSGRESGTNLMPTTGMGHSMHGLNMWRKEASTVWLCEGWSDGVALWEALRAHKRTDAGVAPTSSLDASLGAGANVVAIPGCNSFKDKWAPLFGGKDVILCLDNDHPKTANGKEVAPAGLAGTERICAILSGSENPPTSIAYVKWGDDSWGELFFDRGKKSGYDLRDLINA